MKSLIILNDPPYGTERSYNGLRLVLGKGTVLLCGTCMGARGLAEAEIAPGTRRSTMDELVAAAIAADKVLVF